MTMATHTGYLVGGVAFGSDLPARSVNLQTQGVPDWALRVSAAARLFGGGPRTAALPVASAAVARSGYMAHSFLDDFYDRIHVRPLEVALGHVIGVQQRTVHVWNAHRAASRTVTAMTLTGAADIDITPAAPLVLGPLLDQALTLEIGIAGAPVIDATLSFTVTDDAAPSVHITGQRLQAWPVPAAWNSAITETLEWLSDMQLSVDGSVDAEPLRAAPRRTWEFDSIQGRAERRIIENAVFDWAGRTWALPVWPDVNVLASTVPLGVINIALATTGLDYVANGLALLWRSATQFELVEIDSVAADALTLKRPTLQAWSAGTRIWPARLARLTDAPTWTRKSDRVITSRVRFEAAEPCDWPAVAPAVTYRGYPVLEPGDWAEDPTAETPRELVRTDGAIGLVDVDDVTGLSWQRQSHLWTLVGRSARASHRSLLYWLEGQTRQLWVSTFADDVELLNPVAADDTTITVAFAGIARHLRGQPGRRHLRFELAGGVVQFREVLASAELDAARESLTLDAAFPAGLQPAQVRRISWMMLARRASDRAEISHATDSMGVARCKDSFVFGGRGEPRA